VVSAADFDGRVLLLNFWATWCAPCVREMPMLDEIQQAYADRGLSVVGVALDDVARARSFADELGIGYTILLGAGDALATGLAYGNRAGLLPYSVLVDRDGVVRWTQLGELKRPDLVEQIERRL
jgi:thiol-disulfide isomerase/thioredoxin